VTRESEWDDVERDKMLALAEYDNGMCDCGMHKSVADTDPDLEMTERICPVCSGIARNLRVIADRDAKTLKECYGDKVPPDAPRPEDGRVLGIQAKPPKPEA